MKKFINLLLVFYSFLMLTGCAIQEKNSPGYGDTVAIGYSEQGSYLNTGYSAGYGYNAYSNWYGLSYPSGYNNSIWYVTY